MAILFILLGALFAGIVAVNIQTWLSYKKTFAARTASEDWFKHTLPNYSGDVYNQVVATWRLQLACEQFSAGSLDREKFRLIIQQVAGTLTAFESGMPLGQQLSVHPSYLAAYTAFENLLDAAVKLEQGTAPIDQVRESGAVASALWSRLNKEAEIDEYRLRDRMGYAVVEFRPLAVRSFAISALLSALFVVVVGIMGYATWRALVLDNRRERRFELLLATVGHDMRSPLQALVGAAKLLAAPDISTSEREKFVQIVSERAVFFTRMLDDLIDLARLSTLTFSPAPMDLHHWFSVASARLSSDAREKGLTFEARINAPKRWIMFDEHRLTQCADNLVSNAIRYTDKGSVTFSVHCGFDEGTPRGQITIEVEDTGRGLAAEDQARIFEPFIRLDDRIQGTGIGLSIVRRWARQVGGDVYVARSMVGKG
ncbi:MAG TPA: HAMP domain-containing sensor histidine kinase, partial [Burkholderiaceae bacterium]|nr:HAMP domain-containing sensor histidine kinase [Burkholderiaceae bacterium]